MLSSISERFAPESAYAGRESEGVPPSPRPRHPVATTEVGQLLDLGLALGHERFELVSLGGREEAGVVAAHAWAECGDGRIGGGGGGSSSSRRRGRGSQTPTSHMQPADAAAAGRSRHRTAPIHDDVRAQAGREELRREVEWLRERVDNLSRELVLARKESGRLAKQLKEEEGVGREQRRKANDAIREAKALREELHRLKEDRTFDGAAARAALSDAHSRTVRMAERRRRQQAESLMQAYKGLYEDQLQSQHASAESYRSLTRGYSRLSADNKALRRETAAAAAAAAAVAPVSDAAAESAGALPASSADKQPPTGGVLSSFPVAVPAAAASRERAGRPGKKERRDSARGNGDGGSGVGAEASAGAVPPAACSAAAAAGDGSDRGDAARAYAVTAAESAVAVATAATAVAAAADALAEATTSALPSASLIRKGDDLDAAAAAERECPKRNLGTKRVGVGGSKSSGSGSVNSRGRDRAVASGFGSAETERPSTAETLACSPCSEATEGVSSAATEKPITATAAEKRSYAAGDSGGWVPTAEHCSAAGGTSSRSSGDLHRGHTAKGYAFPQTPGHEEYPSPFRGGGGVTSAGASAAAARPQPRGQDPAQKGGGAGGASVPDDGSSAALGGRARAGRLAKAVPPAEPAPRWRGRSAGPSRLLASSASWAEAGEVEAPKRSNSPPPPPAREVGGVRIQRCVGRRRRRRVQSH